LLIGAPSCQLVLDDDDVSRRHAELRIADGQAMLTDLGSRNGTWLDGRVALTSDNERVTFRVRSRWSGCASALGGPIRRPRLGDGRTEM
jgi:predicted component of type VI protein secretion system